MDIPAASQCFVFFVIAGAKREAIQAKRTQNWIASSP
jgi:hypothetical protein